MVQRFGQSRPAVMEICPNRDRRTPTAKKAARANYQRLLARVLERNFPEFTVGPMKTAADLDASLFRAGHCQGHLIDSI